MTETELERKRQWIQRIADVTKVPQVIFRYEVQSSMKVLYAEQDYFKRWIEPHYKVEVVEVVQPDPKANTSNLKILRTEDVLILDSHRKSQP
jgi:hypothetical protein